MAERARPGFAGWRGARTEVRIQNQQRLPDAKTDRLRRLYKPLVEFALKRKNALGGERGPARSRTTGLLRAKLLACVTPHCDYIEFLPRDLSESPLRKYLTVDHLVMVDGEIRRPLEAGLGIELNREALKEYALAASRLQS